MKIVEKVSEIHLKTFVFWGSFTCLTFNAVHHGTLGKVAAVKLNHLPICMQVTHLTSMVQKACKMESISLVKPRRFIPRRGSNGPHAIKHQGTHTVKGDSLVEASRHHPPQPHCRHCHVQIASAASFGMHILRNSVHAAINYSQSLTARKTTKK